MLLLISVVLGILAGALKKGRLIRLAGLEALWLPIISFAATPVLARFPQMGDGLRGALICVSYLCIFIFTWKNRRFLWGAVLLALGSLCNLLVIALNGFKMPVTEAALDFYPGMTAQAVLETRADYFIAVDGQARLLFLGDVIPVPLPYVGGFISAGDIVLAMGMFFLIFSCMTRPDEDEKKCEEG